ncbi:MAG TPA: MBL fold metallo-hydrolase [Pelagibacterium sp.]|uniref:MBL fold metallo-hydrolase n=1 Tax=Pelagibacterium sp. TaxID=1967288 RepID=UPI002C1E2D7C|nr:MBL fold metallo-hydrolase [Pelagibacterium sp.]HWJ87693.1 MBL fold metallo-hydrolase [Pelagibacterium sp.]
MTAQAKLGQVITKDYRGVTIHTYKSPEEGLYVTSQIVETDDGLVVFDAVFHTRHAEDLADYIAGLGKPVNRIVLSHIHPDHWSGLSVLHQRFPQAPIYALPEIIGYIKENGQKILDARNQAFGNVVAKTPTLPDHELAVGAQTIGGVRFEFERQPDGESDWQTIVRLPDAGVVMVFDLVFPAGHHLFTVASHFDHWIEILDALKSDVAKGYDTLMVGHGNPVGYDVIDANISYLEKAKQIHAANGDADSYAKALKDAYPSYYGGGWVDFSSLLLYGIINP